MVCDFREDLGREEENHLFVIDLPIWRLILIAGSILFSSCDIIIPYTLILKSAIEFGYGT